MYMHFFKSFLQQSFIQIIITFRHLFRELKMSPFYKKNVNTLLVFSLVMLANKKYRWIF